MATRVRITDDCYGLGTKHTDGPRLYRFGSGSELPLLRDDDKDFYKVAYDGRPIFVPKSCSTRIEDTSAADALYVPPATSPSSLVTSEAGATVTLSTAAVHNSESVAACYKEGSPMAMSGDDELRVLRPRARTYPEKYLASAWLANALFVLGWLILMAAFIGGIAYGVTFKCGESDTNCSQANGIGVMIGIWLAALLYAVITWVAAYGLRLLIDVEMNTARQTILLRRLLTRAEEEGDLAPENESTSKAR